VIGEEVLAEVLVINCDSAWAVGGFLGELFTLQGIGPGQVHLWMQNQPCSDKQPS
jgi:hypothetical protein